MSTEILAPSISPELQEEYESSLAKIRTLCANKRVMATISGRLPNTGERDDNETYQKNVDNALIALETFCNEICGSNYVWLNQIRKFLTIYPLLKLHRELSRSL